MIRLITHKDLDGAGAAALIKSVHRDVTVFWCDYTNVDSIVEEQLEICEKYNDQLVITDICPSKETCEYIENSAAEVSLFDHHETKSWVKKYQWANFDNNRCGTLLVHDEYQHRAWGENAQVFALSVDAWDRWQTKSMHRPRGENLNALCVFVGVEEFSNLFSANFSLDQLDTYRTIINYVNQNTERRVKKVIDSQLHSAKYRMDDFGNTFKILFANANISQVAHAALDDEDSKDLHYVVVVSPATNSCSLRSRDPSTNMGALAKRLGGGGHNTAAGFEIKLKEKIEQIVFKRLNLVDSKPHRPY